MLVELTNRLQCRYSKPSSKGAEALPDPNAPPKREIRESGAAEKTVEDLHNLMLEIKHLMLRDPSRNIHQWLDSVSVYAESVVDTTSTDDAIALPISPDAASLQYQEKDDEIGTEIECRSSGHCPPSKSDSVDLSLNDIKNSSSLSLGNNSNILISPSSNSKSIVSPGTTPESRVTLFPSDPNMQLDFWTCSKTRQMGRHKQTMWTCCDCMWAQRCLNPVGYCSRCAHMQCRYCARFRVKCK